MSRAVEAIPNWVNDHASTVLGPQRHRPRTTILRLLLRFPPDRRVLAEYSPRQCVDNADKQAHGGDTGPWWVSMNKDHRKSTQLALGVIQFLTCQSGYQDRPRAVVPLRRGRFRSDADGSPSLAAVRQELLTSPEHWRAAGPLVRFNQNGGGGRTLRSGNILTTDRGRSAASVDVAVPMVDVVVTPEPAPREPRPFAKQGEGLPCCGHGRA